MLQIFQFRVKYNSKLLTHGGDHVSCGSLVVREPQSCQLGGGENDEGLSYGTEGLAQHHHRVQGSNIFTQWCPAEAQQGSQHVKPGSQYQLQSQDRRKEKDQNRFNN